MLLRSGEVEDTRSVLLLPQDPNVDLDAVPQEDARPRRAPLDDPVDARKADQELRTLLVRAEDVEVTYGVLAPPQAPRYIDLQPVVEK